MGVDVVALQVTFELPRGLEQSSKDEDILVLESMGRPAFVEIVKQYPDALFSPEVVRDLDIRSEKSPSLIKLSAS